MNIDQKRMAVHILTVVAIAAVTALGQAFNDVGLSPTSLAVIVAVQQSVLAYLRKASQQH